MIIVDPISMIGDVACTRASPKWVYDRTGTLVEVPANTLGVTYDPSDLSKAPYALIESAATNFFKQSKSVDSENGWSKGANTTRVGAELFPSKVPAVIYKNDSGSAGGDYVSQLVSVVGGETYTVSLEARLVNGARPTAGALISCQTTPGSGNPRTSISFAELDSTVKRFSATFVAQGTGSVSIYFLADRNNAAEIAVANAQIEVGGVATSIIHSGATPITRAADVIGPGAGLVYSNVPMVEPPYDANATYAKDAAVYDPATKMVYWSMLDANKNNALSDPSKWNQRTVINRAAMFDDRNDTQSVNAEDILVVLSTRAIAQGLYLGNLDATEIRVAVTDFQRGLVYTERQDQVMSSSRSSFFRWAFNRIRRRTYFLTLKLPVYANPLITILIRRQGGSAKCGMCMLGPAIDVGLSHYGLSTELKDFSSTTMNPDGTSKTVVRGYAKRMSVDVEIDNDVIDSVEDELIGLRQKVVVWVGTVLFGSAMLVGKFSSLKKVIPRLHKSTMSLQIEGVVSK